MHELSIVSSIVETVTEKLASLPVAERGARVTKVRLRVGALASVVVESLEFCWGIAIEGTPLAGSLLRVNTLPVVVWCVPCAREVELDGVQSFRCPVCCETTMDLRQGRELEIESIEIEDENETEEAGVKG